jgi:hypothetical protein
MTISELMVIVAGTSTVAAIGTAFIRARGYIEDRIKEALSKDEVIEKISLLVKPDMIFNEKGSIVADRGASAFIQDNGIQIKLGNDFDDSIPEEICISFSKHIKIPPLLTPLNPDSVFVTVKRGKSHDWVYSFEYTMTTTPDDSEYLRLYRLEIL